MKGLSLRYDEEWCCHNLVQKCRRANNPPIFLSPLAFALVWPYKSGCSPYRLMVRSQLQRLCHSPVSTEAWGKRICKAKAIISYFPDVTLSYVGQSKCSRNSSDWKSVTTGSIWSKNDHRRVGTRRWHLSRIHLCDFAKRFEDETC